MVKSTHVFYKSMKYPLPLQKDIFAYDAQKIKIIEPNTDIFSWKKEHPLMDEYRQIIEKYARVRKSLPFVEAIYLANSLTFNALHDDSDIDLFMVVSPGRMRIARAVSVILTTLM